MAVLWSAALAAGLVAGLTGGLIADVSADPRSSPGAALAVACHPDPAAPKRQLRGEWIASVENIDWPSAPGLSADHQRAELRRWLDQARARGLNAVFLQVRPTADTFWPSDLEPWSRYLTGVAGKDPGYDPLAFAVRAAHARGLELHAWFNPYRVAMDTDRAALPDDSPAAQHPRWVTAYGGKLYYDPGLPQVRRLTTDVILEAVRRYDIDGVHFDDYFYPYPVEGEAFDDEATFDRYGEGYPDTAAGRADWRRHNTDLLISGLDRRIQALKPAVAFGVSPFAVWRNRGTDPEGSATTAGAETYDDLYADTRGWVRKEWVDYLAPQVYWNIGFEPADYAVLVPWWARQVRGTDVHLYIGQATYKVGVEPAQDPAWLDPGEMSRHLTFNRSRPQVEGDVYFSAKDVRANRLDHVDLLQAEHYAHPALLPVSTDVPGDRPDAVRRLSASPGDVALRLDWQRPQGAAPVEYAVYRVPGATSTPCDRADAAHLVAIVRGRSYVDPHPLRRATYTVTAVDRAHRESAPTSVVVRSSR